MRERLHERDVGQALAPVTLNDVLSMVTDQMSQVVNMDDETKDMFKDLFLRMNSQIIEEN